jgi:hypothetical protein
MEQPVKHSRLLAVAAATVLAGTSAFVAVGSASAATVPSTTWVDANSKLVDVDTDSNAIPVDDRWQAAPDAATPAFTKSGVTAPSGNVIALVHSTSAPVSELPKLVHDARIVSTGDVGLEIWYHDPAAPADEDGILYADENGQAATADDAQWESSESDATGTIEEVTASLPTDAVVTGYGFVLLGEGFAPFATTAPDARVAPQVAVTGTAGVLSSVTFDAQQTYFTPTPVDSISTQTATLSAARANNFTVNSTGFIPGERVDATFGPLNGAVMVRFRPSADANGAVSTIIGPSDTATPGEYLISLVGETSGLVIQFPVTITADPAAPTVVPPTVVAPVATPVRAAATFAG